MDELYAVTAVEFVDLEVCLRTKGESDACHFSFWWKILNLLKLDEQPNWQQPVLLHILKIAALLMSLMVFMRI
jgi:hypothetical protein